ncbi:MAG: hypothetical protein KBD00_00205 [Candidatus Peribacteraceae bacterium]|nr:hypothetical protein [Candidatus Peribacteraceae bacterium]
MSVDKQVFVIVSIKKNGDHTLTFTDDKDPIEGEIDRRLADSKEVQLFSALYALDQLDSTRRESLSRALRRSLLCMWKHCNDSK